MTEYKPFSTGSQYAEWSSRNCGTCKIGFDMKHGKFKCDLHFDLAFASMTNGLITKKVAKAIGYLDNKECITWECPTWERK